MKILKFSKNERILALEGLKKENRGLKSKDKLKKILKNIKVRAIFKEDLVLKRELEKNRLFWSCL